MSFSTRFVNSLLDLNQLHLQNNEKLSQIVTQIMPSSLRPNLLEAIFPLPASIFKHHELITDDGSPIHKNFQSSGTSGSKSVIPISQLTARRQTKAFVETWRPYLGSQRLPMIILDANPNLQNNEKKNSASLAATTAMMHFSRELFFFDPGASQDGSDEKQLCELEKWVSSLEGRSLIMFGFTSQVHKFMQLDVAKRLRGLSLTLIHGGGWKKMQDEMVSRVDFYGIVRSTCGEVDIFDYYGMVEQLGAVWVEGELGLFIPPACATAIIRDPITLDVVLEEGKVGLIQVLSNIPTSYPGHSVLTEDLGSWHESKLSSSGFGIAVHGRLPKTEARGCSDTRL